MKDSLAILQVGHAPEWAVHLQNLGFQVTHTATLADGIAAARSRPFALALLDLGLPDSLGRDTFRGFSEAIPELPVVALIDQWQSANPMEIIALGAQDCLVKEHLTMPILAQALRNAIARQQSQANGSHDRTLLCALMKHIPDAIYFKDLSSRFLMISEAQAKRFHLANPADAAGKTDHDFFTGPHADQALRDELEIIRTGLPLVGIEELETWPDGTETWASTTKMPLQDAAGQIIGTFGISRDITERRRIQEALSLRTRELEQKNQQIVEELKMASELQTAMLPHDYPVLSASQTPGESALEFFSFYHPTGAVSGDFFNVTALSDTQVGVFICDVMGHDVRAALVSAMMRALVQDIGLTTPDPGQLLRQLNQNLFSVFKQTGTTMYATAFYLVADIARGQIQYASAAHPEPIQLRRAAGLVERLVGNGSAYRVKGPALGLFADAQFPTHSRKVEAGDLIALYTDGLVEINSSSDEHQLFTTDLLMKAMERRVNLPTAELFTGVLSEINQFSGRPGFDDDVCLVGMEVKHLG
jgi:sigma-B regulation protein RsbU (phosphoserine phosphatase)